MGQAMIAVLVPTPGSGAHHQPPISRYRVTISWNQGCWNKVLNRKLDFDSIECICNTLRDDRLAPQKRGYNRSTCHITSIVLLIALAIQHVV